jgi:hypothetical protein
MISAIGAFYNPKKPFVYIFHKIADTFTGYKKDMYNFYGYGFEASIKSSACLFKDMERYFGCNDEQWEEIKSNYLKALRAGKVFQDFYRRHSAKKYRKYDMALDLSMEPLKNYSERMKIKLIHENTEYEFIIRDLLRIIKNALCTNDDLYMDPKFPKNPYNNIEFTRENIYTLFITMKYRNYTIPEIFHRFVKNHLDLPYFIIKNETYIRHLCIEDYHSQFSKEDLFEEIILMLRATLHHSNLFIHVDFSKDEVINKFTPIVTLYWLSIHSSLGEERTYYRKLFSTKLNKFILDNPTFGRIIYLRRSKSKIPKNEETKDYKITNYLSREIPYHLTNLQKIKDYMKYGIEIQTFIASSTPINDNESDYDPMSLEESDNESLAQLAL